MSGRRTALIAFEDITAMLCIEIDFAAHIERANAEVPPRIPTAEGNRRAAMTIEGEMTRSLAPGL